MNENSSCIYWRPDGICTRDMVFHHDPTPCFGCDTCSEYIKKDEE